MTQDEEDDRQALLSRYTLARLQRQAAARVPEWTPRHSQVAARIDAAVKRGAWKRPRNGTGGRDANG